MFLNNHVSWMIVRPYFESLYSRKELLWLFTSCCKVWTCIYWGNTAHEEWYFLFPWREKLRMTPCGEMRARGEVSGDKCLLEKQKQKSLVSGIWVLGNLAKPRWGFRGAQDFRAFGISSLLLHSSRVSCSLLFQGGPGSKGPRGDRGDRGVAVSNTLCDFVSKLVLYSLNLGQTNWAN